MKKIINENALIDKMARLHNIKDKGLLKNLWMKSVDKQMQEGSIKDRKDPLFWRGDGADNKGVINYFKEEIKTLNIEEARMLMDSREEFKKSSYEFLDSLVKGDYSNANVSFPNAVKNKLINMINNRKEVYLKQLQKKVNNIAKDD
jgi:hypothetical protein